MSFKIAAAQFAPVYLDLDKSIDRACELIAEAAALEVKLLVFPEAFLPGYPDWVWVVPNHDGARLGNLWTRLVKNSVQLEGDHVRTLSDCAGEHGVCVAMGMHERNSEASNASLYNTILFLEQDGSILGRRRKLTPTGAERQIWSSGDGSALGAYESSLGRIGGLICWENFMPLARQSMYDAGVQILVAPTWDKSANWLESMKYIAREGGMFVVSCCPAIGWDDIPDDCDFKEFYPSEREWINVGNSCVINPRGEVVAGPLEAEKGFVIAEIDLDDIHAAKRMFDVAGHYARPDVFDFHIRP